MESPQAERERTMNEVRDDKKNVEIDESDESPQKSTYEKPDVKEINLPMASLVG